MTKKKSSRQKRQKDATDTSEAENEISVPFQGKLCPHVNRAVNLGRVKRTLKIGSISTCNGCADPPPEDETPEVWLCLQCGYCGCGRMAPQKHGLQHFKTIHSDCHSLVLSTSSSVVWCYDCDDEVQLQSSKNLKQSVDFILKMKVNNNNNVEVAKNEKKSSNQPSLLETVPKEENNCKKVSNGILKISETKTENKNKKNLVPVKISAKGLRNLGNTCYFNAVMQNLCQTSLLFHGLDESCSVDYKWDIPKLIIVNDTVVEEPKAEPLSITLPKEFLFVHTFYVFLKKMISNPQKSETINPEDLFKLLQKKAPQFQSYAQQDSHELLRSFLEGIKQDEIKRHRKAILRHFNVMENTEDLDDCTKKLIKEIVLTNVLRNPYSTINFLACQDLHFPSRQNAQINVSVELKMDI
ncbi:ubiquitin carboxyl-terminal hydrolase 16 [Caerostris extrusa]|uniref:ubiquitinyl hydrolase 1 n=1 Tax=Caerostris extrusa TaxID=172846 RepID=A0AAV4Y5B1_CAEEX|nr:ubiquitin carboxyl-terminal hydrolase 16 [Caerostris extrusa]